MFFLYENKTINVYKLYNLFVKNQTLISIPFLATILKFLFFALLNNFFNSKIFNRNKIVTNNALLKKLAFSVYRLSFIVHWAPILANALQILFFHFNSYANKVDPIFTTFRTTANPWRIKIIIWPVLYTTNLTDVFV